MAQLEEILRLNRAYQEYVNRVRSETSVVLLGARMKTTSTLITQQFPAHLSETQFDCGIEARKITGCQCEKTLEEYEECPDCVLV